MNKSDLDRVLDGITSRLDGVTKRLDGYDRDRDVDRRLLEEVARKTGALPPIQRDAPPDQRDAPVSCPKCGGLLGYYDTPADILRTRRGDHVVRMRLGVGGAIWIQCHRCAEDVMIPYAPPDDLATVEVGAGGVLVLGAAQLAELLGRALEDRAHTTSIRLVGAPSKTG